MVMRRTICGLIGALSAFSGASAYGKILTSYMESGRENLSAIPSPTPIHYSNRGNLM